jgi:prepilin-type N-terminal cleavage/methylation domain-containing protein
MYDSPSNKGFTLIEVLAAVGAFTIAFLAGFAAIGTFMLKQDMNYQRTVAAGAAAFLSEWHANKTLQSTGASRPRFGDSDSPIPASFSASGSILKLAIKKGSSNLNHITFKGGDARTPSDALLDDLFVFETGSVSDGNGNTVDLSSFGYDMENLIVTVSSSSAETVGSTTLPVRQVSFWYGSRSDVLSVSASSKTTVQFLGRYAIMESAP